MTEENIYPEFFARFYDVLYEKLRGGEDTQFYQRKIAETQGSVLELGVGTGRFFIEALNSGANIYGIDVSPQMIRVLKKKLDNNDHHRIAVQDARFFDFKRKFKLIIAPFRLFSHIIDVSDQLKVLNQVNKHLTPDGTFIFDLYVPDLSMLSKGIHDLVDFDGEYEKGRKLKRIVNMHADIISQISYVNMKLIWEENEKRIEKDWNFEMRYFFRFELEHLIQRSKLNLVRIYGDFNENNLQSGSKEFVVVCRKSK